jgi:hypothetical protein
MQMLAFSGSTAFLPRVNRSFHLATSKIERDDGQGKDKQREEEEEEEVRTIQSFVFDCRIELLCLQLFLFVVNNDNRAERIREAIGIG